MARNDTSVQLKVCEDGKSILVYNFKSTNQAMEVAEILRDYFPSASFVLQSRRVGGAERAPLASCGPHLTRY